MRKCKIYVIFFLCVTLWGSVDAQEVIRGIVRDAVFNDPIIGANVIIEGTTEGTITDWDGSFEITTTRTFPLSIRVSYIGYADELIEMASNERVQIVLKEDAAILEEVVVKGSRISDKQKESPLTIEALGLYHSYQGNTSF